MASSAFLVWHDICQSQFNTFARRKNIYYIIFSIVSAYQPFVHAAHEEVKYFLIMLVSSEILSPPGLHVLMDEQ